MGESTKVACVLILSVSAIATALAWIAEKPDATTWSFRIGGPVISLLSLGLFLKIHFRRDLEKDYLRLFTRTYFNRVGFCFACVVSANDGIASMDAYFQTQYDKPSVGRIALRPARGFFMTRAKIDLITFEIEYPPAGFGYARIAIPIPEEIQGKRQSFEVGASVFYPNGKGNRIRFYDGECLRSNTNFANSFGTALTVVGAATGSLVLFKPATTTMDLPFGVAEETPESIVPEIKILWQMGDPPLEAVA